MLVKERETLDGLMRLYKLVEYPTQITKAELAEKTGIPDWRVQTLSNHGIITCKRVSHKGHGGTKYSWQWTAPVPNIKMAQKLLSIGADYKPKKQGKKKASYVPKLPVKKVDNSMHSSLSVKYEYEISNKLNGYTAVVNVVPISDKMAKLKAEIPVEMSIEELRCYGHALLRAADKMSESNEG